MGWRRLTSDEELQAFRGQGRMLWNVDCPVDYLRHGDVYGYFTPSGELKGGLALVYDTPLRTLSFFSPEARAKSPLLSTVPDSSFCEVAGFFYDPHTKDRSEALRAWLFMLNAVRRTGKSHAVWGYNLAFEGLTRIYSQLGATTLFSGEVPVGAAPRGSAVARGAILAVAISRVHFYIPWMIFKRWARAKTRGAFGLGKRPTIQAPVATSPRLLPRKQQ